MKELLRKISLLKIDNLKFDSSLSGGRASATLVYKNSKESVIVKLLIAPRNEFELKRFNQEADALKFIEESLMSLHEEVTIPKLKIPLTQHKNLPVYYFGMEKIDGKRLDDIFKAKPLPWTWEDSVEMLFRISSALKFIELRYIHRDLHPLNIIIQDDFKYSAHKGMYSKSGVKILDFGCTKDSFNYYFGLWDDDAFRIPGAVSSWSPELLMNPNEVDHFHDSWALGVIFYRLLTNKYPYPANNFGDIINYEKNVLSTFQEIDKLNLPLAIRLLVQNCLKLNKNERFSVSQIVDVCNDIFHTDLLKLYDNRIKKYFENGASLCQCNHCHTEDISGRNNKCSKCGHILEDENISNMLNYK